ncbi:DUF982 domain-containing protein [Rhizobium sp. BK251]|uniref:DUF982 domain-containing protein n=1 Tax=Rhizobium sp. BK251 TaxID=2512125 RepID=UPI0010538894|nr:DUF982 domain-containing protein [Rhizobium sp. BK251]
MLGYTSHQFPALTLVGRGKQKYRVITTVIEAAETLMTDWPDDDGEEYVAAVYACLRCLYDEIPPDSVRTALMRAADEVRISYISVVS